MIIIISNTIKHSLAKKWEPYHLCSNILVCMAGNLKVTFKMLFFIVCLTTFYYIHAKYVKLQNILYGIF